MKKLSVQLEMFNRKAAAFFPSFFTSAKKMLTGLKLGRSLFILVILVGLLIIFGKRGLIDSYMMKEKAEALERENRDIALQNQDLRMYIALLKNDPAYIEMIARNELGMVKKGDMVYRYTGK